MRQDKEIKALLRLIDDPDGEVYDTVAQHIMHYGKAIIPSLEELWEHTIDEGVQERIELLIHRVHFQDLQAEFHQWCKQPHPELLRGAILVAKLVYPDLNVPSILSQFDQMRRNIWLELNAYLTPLEQVNVLNSILYNYYKLTGHELTERDPKYFFINNVVESRQGNAYTLGVLYLSLCELLDVPVFAVDLPRQFVFAYIDTVHPLFSTPNSMTQHISFFVDPLNGSVYTHQDVEGYLHKINARDRDAYFTPISSKRVIYKMLEELALCYRYRREDEKADEVQELMRMIAMPD